MWLRVSDRQLCFLSNATVTCDPSHHPSRGENCWSQCGPTVAAKQLALFLKKSTQRLLPAKLLSVSPRPRDPTPPIQAEGVALQSLPLRDHPHSDGGNPRSSHDANVCAVCVPGGGGGLGGGGGGVDSGRHLTEHGGELKLYA